MSTPPLTVLRAKRILTMEPDLPEATAVGILDGRIAGVGAMSDLQPWLDHHEHVVDDSLADKVLLPGFIDPHVHPLLPAILTQMPFAAPDDWRLPHADYPGVRTPDAFVSRLRELLADHPPGDAPFFVWGYHPLFHGKLDRAALDSLVGNQPVFLWHRSFHEIIANSAGLAYLGDLDVEALPDSARSQLDLDRGRFFEGGLAAIFPKIQPLFFAGIAAGFARFAEMVHRGGITTIADMGTGLMAPLPMEAALIRQTLGGDDCPFRTLLTPIETAYVSAGQTPVEALAEVTALLAEYQGKVSMHRHFKLMADGAFFSQLFQLGAPGYTDGHSGEWVVPPEVTEAFARTFWDAGFQLHVHCNGDAGAHTSLALLRRLLDQRPRFDHRFTLEHWGYATEEQNRSLAALGAVVSGQPWYVHVLGDVFSEHGLGSDRAHQMCRFGSLVEKGVPLALHSDCPMAPLEPLRLAWAAATRQTMSGTELGPAQRLTLEQALRAVTVDAAWILGLEDDIGSIRTGKRADFTVLDADPFEVGVPGLAELRPWGTVFAGRIAPIAW